MKTTCAANKENDIGKKVVSERKRLANQRNAKKSTGPRTLLGKQKVRLNAIKHGLLSTATAARHGEESQEFRALISQLETVFRPVSLPEKQLVEEAASLIWNLRATSEIVWAILYHKVLGVKIESVLRYEDRFAAKLADVLRDLSFVIKLRRKNEVKK
jgi:hypothetical protein